MKRISIICFIFMFFLTGCGWIPEVPTHTAEVLYQKEGYESPYTYVMTYSVSHDYPIKLEIMGLNFLSRQIRYSVTLQPDGSIKTIETQEEADVQRREIKKYLDKSVSQEELDELLEYTMCRIRQYQDVTYILFAKKEVDGYHCVLFAYRGETDTQRLDFIVSQEVLERQNGFWWEVFEDNSICFLGEVWFDAKLVPVQRSVYEEGIDELTKEQIKEELKKTGIAELEALAEDEFFSAYCRRYGEVFVCFDVSWGSKKYVFEFDEQGNLMYGVHIYDPNQNCGWGLKVYNYDPETDTYYHIKRQVGK